MLIKIPTFIRIKTGSNYNFFIRFRNESPSVFAPKMHVSPFENVFFPCEHALFYAKTYLSLPKTCCVRWHAHACHFLQLFACARAKSSCAAGSYKLVELTAGEKSAEELEAKYQVPYFSKTENSLIILVEILTFTSLHIFAYFCLPFCLLLRETSWVLPR